MTGVEGDKELTLESVELDTALGRNLQQIYDKVLCKSVKEYALLIQKKLQECEADRAAKLDLIHQHESQISEINADREARLEFIRKLEGQLAASEADRAARLEFIRKLEGQLAASEADRAARLEFIKRQEEQILALQKGLVWQLKAALRKIASFFVTMWF